MSEQLGARQHTEKIFDLDDVEKVQSNKKNCLSKSYNIREIFSTNIIDGEIWYYGGHFLTISFMGQVQERKVKKVCHMNAAPSHATGNGLVVGSSTSNSFKSCNANGGCNMIPFNNASILYRDVQSLRLPVVVVLILLWCYSGTWIKISVRTFRI